MTIKTFVKPRRVVAKAFSGTQAIQALLIQHAGHGHTETIQTTRDLLSHGLCAADVSAITGLNHGIVLKLETAQHPERSRAKHPGRPPTNLLPLFQNPRVHLHFSIFLAAIADICQGQTMTGEALNAALNQTRAHAGVFNEMDQYMRRLVHAVDVYYAGGIELTACTCCGIRYAKLMHGFRKNTTSSRARTCPFCAHLNFIKARAAAGSVARTPSSFESESLVPTQRAAKGRQSYAALMSGSTAPATEGETSTAADAQAGSTQKANYRLLFGWRSPHPAD